ncbi:MAG: GNAT family N-acetyltransferase [Aminipila sp.]
MDELKYQVLDYCHQEGLLGIWTDPDVIRYTNMRIPCTVADVKQRIAIFKDLDVFAVIKQERLIGIIGCPPINKATLQFGLFYQFSKSSWGKGNASIATKWLIDYMKQKYKDVILFADVVVENVASEKVLQKLGFHQISEETIQRDGKILKVHNYKL